MVICTSISADFTANYRREVALGRALAARGVAVQRFHYRGTGHTFGEPEAMTFSGMVEDALAAADQLRSSTGVSALAFMGTRWGALVSAAAARRFPGAPLILWEPVLEAKRFFRDATRARIMASVAQNKAERLTGERIIAELKEHGTLDILGYTMGLPLYETSEARTLTDELGDDPRPLLLVPLNPAAAVDRRFTEAAARWSEKGFAVTTTAIAVQESWWFRDDKMPGTVDDLVDLTGDWLLGQQEGHR
ncbi:MAG: serine aminopeptidase domain-containing protein [Actinomycetota bacterium]